MIESGEDPDTTVDGGERGTCVLKWDGAQWILVGDNSKDPYSCQDNYDQIGAYLSSHYGPIQDDWVFVTYAW